METTFIKWSLLFAAGVLALVCLIMPAIQWASVPHDPIFGFMAGITAVALGVAKIAFFPAATMLWQDKRYLIAGCLFIAGSVFTVISIASVSQFLSAQQSLSHKVHAGNNSEVALIDKEISHLNDLISADVANGYRKRAYEYTQRVNQLRVERKITESITTNNNQLYFFKIGRITPNILISISIHVSLILSIMAWVIITQNHTKCVKKNNNYTNSVGSSSLDQDQLQLADRILSGEFGNKPTLKWIINNKLIKGGYNRVKPVFTYMYESGYLMKEGNQYLLKSD